MQKKFLFMVFILVCWASPVLAHDFWAGAKDSAVGQPANVFLGFGHDFPEPDEIKPETYAERYDPVTLIGVSGPIALKAGDQAQNFVSEGPLSAGSYYVLVNSKVGFASRTPSGYVRKSKAEDPTATTCSYGGNFGKNLINLDPASDDSFVTKPVGHKLEIVPQVNPETVKVGEKFPVKVLLDGSPLPRATVEAFFAGFYEDNEALAFSASTDKDGLVYIIPLRPGKWLANVSHTVPYSDLKVCDREAYGASLAFTIK